MSCLLDRLYTSVSLIKELKYLCFLEEEVPTNAKPGPAFGGQVIPDCFHSMRRQGRDVPKLALGYREGFPAEAITSDAAMS